MAIKSVAITGASGFIGTALCALFESRGVQVFRLMRARQPMPASSIDWNLGEPLPQLCETVDAVVHLATAAFGKSAEMAKAAATDVNGAQVLIDSVRQLEPTGRRPRFIFMSSQSARPDASNAYGRVKWKIENLLNQPNEISVRPGLVYSDPPASVFALFEKLARMPVIPMIKSNAAIQPIDVDELAECVLGIFNMAAPPGLFELGALKPMTFEEAIRAVAARANLRGPIMIPIPATAVRIGAAIADQLFHPAPSIGERLEGLTSLRPMNTAPSLKLLGCQLRPFSNCA